MKILFISPDIEEKARGINVILKSLITAAKDSGHDVSLLAGYPIKKSFDKSEKIKSTIDHVYIQHYIQEGRDSFRYSMRGSLKLNLLLAFVTFSVFKLKFIDINKNLLAGNAGWMKKIDHIVQSPFIYQLSKLRLSVLVNHQIKKIVRKGKFDLVIVASPSSFKKKSVGRAKLVHFVHDTMPYELIETPPDNNTPVNYASDFFSSVIESDLLLSNSVDTQNKILDIFPKAKIKVVYGAPSANISETPQTSIVNNLGLQKKNYLVFVSTIEKRKNVENLLEAYSLAFDKIKMPLVLIGGPGYGIGDIQTKFSDLPKKVQGNIIFTGYLSEPDKYTLLRNSTLCVFPSFYEGFGLVVTEAMSCGVPVLTTSRGALPEVGGDAAEYISNPYDIAEIADKLTNLIDSKERRDKLIKKGYVQAEKFTQEKFERRIKEVFKSIK